MEKQKTLAARAYRLLSCRRFFDLSPHKEREESLLLIVKNDGGDIRFSLTDLPSGETLSLDNPQTGEYAFPLKKGSKARLLILARNAIGAYRIVKKTILDPEE